MIITIDGPSGTGKTTIARRVAERLNFTYVDTGAMYRAVTYHFLYNERSLETFVFEIRVVEGEKHYFVGGEDVTAGIRSPDVTRHVSEVSAHADVRKLMVALQRRLAEGTDAVFEGRDMATFVFPDAELKIYLDASSEVRAERRYDEFVSKGLHDIGKDDVLEDILRRDTYDSTRDLSPLRRADDAHYIDTSDLSIDEVVEDVVSRTRN